jgi:hypothetical protein
MFLNTSAQPGQNLYICTSSNVWTVQGTTGLGNYATTFAGVTTFTVPGTTHQLGTANLFVALYDTEVPANLVEPDSVQINAANYNVTVNFAIPQSGTVILSAAGGGGGGASPVTSVFGRLGTVTAQAGDYTAAQVTNAAATNASNTFTAGTQNFRGATHTLPAVTGLTAAKPGTCTVGEMYFATDATAGQNWYYCTATNTWTAQVAGGGSVGIGLNGTTQGTYNTLNLITSAGMIWQLTPGGQTLNITPALDSAIVPSKVAADTYAPGAKQWLSPNTTTAGLNLSSAPLPSAPAEGDLAIDPTGNLNWYDGTGWRLGTVADAALTAGTPVVGDGANHVTTGSVTGSGSFVLSTDPTISNPTITSFVNSNHNHSNAANGGAIANTAFAGPVTFATLPACSSSTEGSRGAVSDSTTNTWGAMVTGGGINHILAYCDGTNWTVAAK